jgi:hypothetical protein
MARLPDRFDLWVRRAKESTNGARRADYVLGALAGLKEWHFPGIGTVATPQAATARIGPDFCRLVLTDIGRVEDLRESGAPREATPLSVITVPSAAAMAWCVKDQTGLFVNPGEEAVIIPFEQLEIFYTEWTRKGGRRAAGYWIPNMTSQEEDFWQEHGL